MIRFTLAELEEKAEAFKNYKEYIRDYWWSLRDKEPMEKHEYHKGVIADKFGLSISTVQRIIYCKKVSKVAFKVPKTV